ncbi:hypothetical protein [Hymenobacter sp. IS2118]|uniref:hypothetical protein n=1 Tax=Hymenobacter sp. IS2118 TaxID=1505605 RepID=UPI000AC7A9AC|nr:hypothetical protein [Hymenobacter sp. IS2118]
MLDLVASVLFQLAVLFAGGTPESTSTQTNSTAPETHTEVNNAGGTGGWTGIAASSSNTGG